MNRFLLAGIAAFGLAGAASAANAADWQGLYVAGGVGYGAWTADTTQTTHGGGPCALCVNVKQGGTGALGSIAIGFDHPLSGQWVGGVFIDGDLANIKGNVQDAGPFYVAPVTETSAISEGARVGWLVNPTTLPYLDVGASQAHFKGGAEVNNCCGATSGAATGYSLSSTTRSGFFVGAGVELKLHGHWAWKSEYRYADYGKATLTDSNGASFEDDNTIHPIVQSVRTEVVYRF